MEGAYHLSFERSGSSVDLCGGGESFPRFVILWSMNTFIKDFKAFATRGNVIDLAFAVIIGTAFGKIVSSLVEDIIMPPVGFLIGGVNFSDLAVSLETGVGEPVLIQYGIFLQSVLDFVIIAAVLFLVLKAVTKMQKEKPAEAPKKSDELRTLEEIRDLLKK
jgi:large conductance mechanosensitive channel